MFCQCHLIVARQCSCKQGNLSCWNVLHSHASTCLYNSQTVTLFKDNVNFGLFAFPSKRILFISWHSNVTFQSFLECIRKEFFKLSCGHKWHQTLRTIFLIYLLREAELCNAQAFILLLCTVRGTLAALWHFHHVSDLFHCIHFDPFVINFLPPHVEQVALKLLR